MSADSKTKKRKSGDDVAAVAKKVKTAKSADRPAPPKSALKKTKVEMVEEKTMGKKSKKTTKEVIEQPIEIIEQPAIVMSDAENEGAELTADQTAALLAGFSSDEDDEEPADEGIDISKLPAAPIKSSAVVKLASDGTDDPETTPGVIFLSRIPHGFYEKQMHAYFSQFGTITHIRLARNRKTGKSKHFAFIEFASSAVADIVAKTMNKYLLFGHILQARRVPPEQVKEGLWKGVRGKVAPRNRLEGTKLKKGMVREGWEKRITREEKRRLEKQKKLEELGYEFEIPSVKKVSEVPVNQNAVEAVEDGEAGAVEEPEEGGVELLEGYKTEAKPGVEKKVEKKIKKVADTPKIVKEKTVKRKSKDAGATSTMKKRKTAKAAA